jgi:hypothetical protein
MSPRKGRTVAQRDKFDMTVMLDHCTPDVSGPTEAGRPTAEGPADGGRKAVVARRTRSRNVMGMTYAANPHTPDPSEEPSRRIPSGSRS